MYMTLKSVDMFASSVFTGDWVFKFSGEVLEEIIILFRFEMTGCCLLEWVENETRQENG